MLMVEMWKDRDEELVGFSLVLFMSFFFFFPLLFLLLVYELCRLKLGKIGRKSC